MSLFKKIKNKPNPSVSFSHGLLGDINFDFAYLNSNGERTEELVHYWHNPSENITKEFKKFKDQGLNDVEAETAVV